MNPHINPDSGYSSAHLPAGQAQMRRNELVDQLSQQQPPNQDHDTNFFEETGGHMKNMAHGAADVGKGAALGAVSMARGAAVGAANIAHGAADAVKHTFGMDDHPTGNTPSGNWSNHPPGAGGGGNPTNRPTSANAANINATSNLADTTNYPANLMDDNITAWSGPLNTNPNPRKNI